MKPVLDVRHPHRDHSWKAIDFMMVGIFLTFSFWIMSQTFSYDHSAGNILVGTRLWSDFAANIPLIRSFSLGDNWPPEYPIFPGEPIRYHFLFFLLVGKLEALGLPIDWALNLPSALGFALLLSMVYLVALRLFCDRRVAILSVAFFLFNGSLGYVQFFERFPTLMAGLAAIPETTEFSAMGPWDGGKVLAFWHLNVFTNQRHFGPALGLLFGFLYLCLWLENKQRRTQILSAALAGVIVGFFPLFHKPVTLLFAVAMTVFFLALPYLRLFLLLMGAVSIVVMALLHLSAFSLFGPAESSLSWHPGFTPHGSLEWGPMLEFLWFQFGLHCILVPLGIIMAPARAKVFMLPAILVLVLAFTVKFSPDILANHKLINFSIISLQMLSAYVLIRAFDLVRTAVASAPAKRRYPIQIATGAVVSGAVVMTTLSGVIDLFPIVNERYFTIGDVKADARVRWFHENTPRDALVLNSTLLYHPASIAGRKVFLGWPYFTTTAGYDHDSRFEIVQRIYGSEDPYVFCPLLRAHGIGYLTVEDTTYSQDLPQMDVAYFRQHFDAAFQADGREFAIYDVSAMCGPY